MAKSLIFAASAVASLLLARHAPEYSPPIVWTFLGLYSVLLTSVFMYRTVLYPRFFSPIRHIPTPKGAHWLLGHFPDIFRYPTGNPQLRWVEELSNNDGLIRYIGLFGGERIMPCNAKTLSEVLHHKSYHFIKPPFMRQSIGNVLGLRGLLFAEGDEHRHQRKLLLPAFSHSHIKNLVPTFWSISRDLTESISSIVAAAENGVPVIEMGRWCSLATLDIIGRAGFGYEFHALETSSEEGESKNELAWAYNTMFKPTGWAMGMHIARIVFPGWFLKSLPLRRNKEVRKASQTIKRISVEIINAKKLELAEKKSTGGGDERDILSIMLNSGNYHGADGVEAMRDQMMTFLTAGHETTATAMMWGLHILSLKENHHIQIRLREEIRAAFPQGIPENVSYEQIEALKYLRNVTAEVLRVYPPVTLTARHAAEDTTLGGQFIPKGSHIVIVPWAINHNKELWGEDADVFKPERWEDQLESNYSFMTFLAGPRGCIGNVFAKVEYKCLLAALIGRFDFAEAVEGRVIVVKAGLTAKPQDGVPLKVSVVPGW